MEEWKKEQEELKAQKEEDGEVFEPEEREWEEIQEPAYPTEIKKFVICLDTMGQDRSLTKDQIDFALQTVKTYSESWTTLEQKNLKRDILQWEQTSNEEKILIDPEDAPSNRFEDEENQFINDFFAEQDPEEPMDEETKQSHIPKLRWKWITNKICSDEFKKHFLDLKKFKVVKFPWFF